jgi:hypothetical protein
MINRRRPYASTLQSDADSPNLIHGLFTHLKSNSRVTAAASPLMRFRKSGTAQNQPCNVFCYFLLFLHVPTPRQLRPPCSHRRWVGFLLFLFFVFCFHLTVSTLSMSGPAGNVQCMERKSRRFLNGIIDGLEPTTMTKPCSTNYFMRTNQPRQINHYIYITHAFYTRN